MQLLWPGHICLGPCHGGACAAAGGPSSPRKPPHLQTPACCSHPPRRQVGLNAHRVLHGHEWRRLGTSLVVHADLPHLVSNSTALILEVRPPSVCCGLAPLLERGWRAGRGCRWRGKAGCCATAVPVLHQCAAGHGAQLSCSPPPPLPCLPMQGLPLEQRLGSVKLVGLVATSALLTNAMYCE